MNRYRLVILGNDEFSFDNVVHGNTFAEAYKAATDKLEALSKTTIEKLDISLLSMLP